MAFGFGNKKTLSIEEKKQWDEQLDTVLQAENYQAAFAKAKEYEKLDKYAASYYLAYLYYIGKGVKAQDVDKAAAYITRYTEKFPEDGRGWFVGSDIMMVHKKPEDAIAYLTQADRLKVDGAGRKLANLCSYMGLAYRNAAWVTAKVEEYRGLNAKAIRCFTRSIQNYYQLYQVEQVQLEEFEWIQFGYVVHYMHYLALSGALTGRLYDEDNLQQEIEAAYQLRDAASRDRTPTYWKELAVKVIEDMEAAGHRIPAIYTRAMLASSEADLEKSKDALEQAKMLLDQADEVAQGQAEHYRAEFADVWKEYERLVRNTQKAEKKGVFGKNRK